MKRTIAILFALVMVLSLAACGGGSATTNTPAPTEAENTTAATDATEPPPEPTPVETETPATPEPTEEPTSVLWTVQQTTDEFGDTTANSVSALMLPFSGDFSNTATSNSKLSGYVLFAQKPDSDHYIAEFTLFEYENTKATYISSDSLTLKVKLDDTIYDFPLIGESPNGSLFLGIEPNDYGGDWLFDELYFGWDLRCIINIGSSRYNFTIESGNFAEICDNEGFPFAPAEMTVKEAVNGCLSSAWANESFEYFANHINDYPLMDGEQLNEILNGNFLEMECEGSYNWAIYNYSNGIRTQTAIIKLSDRDASETSYEKAFTIVDNVLKGGLHAVQFHKLSDDIYVSYRADYGSSDYNIPDYLIIRYNGSILSYDDVTDTMIPYIQEYLIPQIGA